MPCPGASGEHLAVGAGQCGSGLLLAPPRRSGPGWFDTVLKAQGPAPTFSSTFGHGILPGTRENARRSSLKPAKNGEFELIGAAGSASGQGS